MQTPPPGGPVAGEVLSPTLDKDSSPSSENGTPQSQTNPSLSPYPQSPAPLPDEAGTVDNDYTVNGAGTSDIVGAVDIAWALPLDNPQEPNQTSMSSGDTFIPGSYHSSPESPPSLPANNDLQPLSQDQLSETAWLVDFVNRHYGPEEIKNWEMITAAFNQHFKTTKSQRGVIVTYSNIKRSGKPKHEWKRKRPVNITEGEASVGRRSKRLRREDEDTSTEETMPTNEQGIVTNPDMQLHHGDGLIPAEEVTVPSTSNTDAKPHVKASLRKSKSGPQDTATGFTDKADSIKTRWVATGNGTNNDYEGHSNGWDSKATQATWIFDYVTNNYGDNNKVDWDAVTAAFNGHFGKRKGQSGVRVTYFNVVRARAHANGIGKRTSTPKSQSMNKLAAATRSDQHFAAVVKELTTATKHDQDFIAAETATDHMLEQSTSFTTMGNIRDFIATESSTKIEVDRPISFTAVNYVAPQPETTTTPSIPALITDPAIRYAGPHVPPSDTPIKPEVAWILDYVDSHYGPDEPKDWKCVTEEFNKHFVPKKNQSGVRVTYTNIMRGGMANRKNRGGGASRGSQKRGRGGVSGVSRSPLKRLKSSVTNLGGSGEDDAEISPGMKEKGNEGC